jgi:hypothetical protein
MAVTATKRTKPFLPKDLQPDAMTACLSLPDRRRVPRRTIAYASAPRPANVGQTTGFLPSDAFPGSFR